MKDHRKSFQRGEAAGSELLKQVIILGLINDQLCPRCFLIGLFREVGVSLIEGLSEEETETYLNEAFESILEEAEKRAGQESPPVAPDKRTMN